MPNTSMSRRAMLANVPAALTLAAILPTAALAGGNDNEADAELVRLGVEFDRLYAEYVVVLEEMLRISDRFEKEAERQGISPARNRNDYAKWVRLSYDSGHEAAIAASNAKAEIIDEIARRIRAIPAVGVAGMAVKASVLHFDCLNDVEHVGYWSDESYDPDDWRVEQVHSFVAEIRAVAALPPLRALNA